MPSVEHVGTLGRWIGGSLEGRLFWWLLAAALLGWVSSGLADTLASAVPFILAIMIGGLGLSLPSGRLIAGFKRVRLLAAGLAAQLIFTPLAAWLLWTLARPVLGSVPQSVWSGLAVQAAAPGEITSPLLAGIAGGSVAAALPVMSLSVLLAPVTMPAVLGLILGAEISVSYADMLWSLLLTVAAPLLAGSALHGRMVRTGLAAPLGRAVSALMVVLLVFTVAAGAAAEAAAVSVSSLIAVAAFSLCILAAGFGGGWLMARLSGLEGPNGKAIVFTTGMREFGIGSAVALSFFGPQAAIVPAVYGVIMMLASSVLAAVLRR